MGVILKVNELGYESFLSTPVNSFIIGLKDYCVNQKYSLPINKLTSHIDNIKKANKHLYLNINLFASEKDIKKLKKMVLKLKNLDIDGFVVSDLGVVNLLKEYGLANKIILDLHTYVTNKYSAQSLLNLGVDRVCIAKEITIDDIKEISSFNKGKIEIQCQGYYPITYSKRPILETYYKNFKLKSNKDIHYIKEENRDSYYSLIQSKNNLSVYYDKEYSVFPYLDELINNKINHFRIDADFLDEQTIKNYIFYYDKALSLINSNDLDGYNKLKEEFISKYVFETPFMNKKSFLLKEGS